MKTYNVNFERKGEIVSTFYVHADSYKSAKKVGQFHKRHNNHKGKVTIKLFKSID